MEDIGGMTYRELQKELKRLGLSAKGKTDELRARLEAHLAAGDSTDANTAEATDEEGEGLQEETTSTPAAETITSEPVIEEEVTGDEVQTTTLITAAPEEEMEGTKTLDADDEKAQEADPSVEPAAVVDNNDEQVTPVSHEAQEEEEEQEDEQVTQMDVEESPEEAEPEQPGEPEAAASQSDAMEAEVAAGTEQKEEATTEAKPKVETAKKPATVGKIMNFKKIHEKQFASQPSIAQKLLTPGQKSAMRPTSSAKGGLKSSIPLPRVSSALLNRVQNSSIKSIGGSMSETKAPGASAKAFSLTSPAGKASTSTTATSTNGDKKPAYRPYTGKIPPWNGDSLFSPKPKTVRKQTTTKPSTLGLGRTDDSKENVPSSSSTAKASTLPVKPTSVDGSRGLKRPGDAPALDASASKRTALST